MINLCVIICKCAYNELLQLKIADDNVSHHYKIVYHICNSGFYAHWKQNNDVNNATKSFLCFLRFDTTEPLTLKRFFQLKQFI